ncbi:MULTISPECIES: hypothetical protein [Vibrio]|uniref:hypothetical protein n=1 Tax=Vibrio TaxID=662 RepID=UPI000C828EFB|nr:MULTISPECIES: hypothetical protein [Vibrio]MCF7504181.1 hypothetical protein [Vibrio sp. L3-7]PMN78481.1 hypothetical protein BCT24_04670 [Vibrio splendidus]TVU75419.1 hypothetical protein FQP87_11075 [Vibrio tasmaniensis]
MNTFYREAPWDSRVFGLSCCEIINFDEDSTELDCHIQQVKNTYDFIYGRVGVNSKVRTLLSEQGFVGTEISALAKLTKLQKRNLVSKPLTNIYLNSITSDYQQEIIESADKMYSYSRFHESPFITGKLANLRMKNWVVDLISNNTPCLLLILNEEGKSKLLGYMFFSRENKKANLLLGGVLNGEGIHALTLWQQVLIELQNSGVNVVTARVSLSNSGVVKLYQHYDFQLTDFLIDYQMVKNNG